MKLNKVYIILLTSKLKYIGIDLPKLKSLLYIINKIVKSIIQRKNQIARFCDILEPQNMVWDQQGKLLEPKGSPGGIRPKVKGSIIYI